MTITIDPVAKTSPQVETLGFSGGERHVQLHGLPKLPDSLNIRARIKSSDDLMDLILTLDALREQFGENLWINVEIPYLPYARQDRACAPGQACSARVLRKVLHSSLGKGRVVCWDIHSQAAMQTSRVESVAPGAIIQRDQALVELLGQRNTLLVAPDAGARARTRSIALAFNVRQSIEATKVRNPLTGDIEETTLSDDVSVRGKTCVITDDICDGGATFIKLARQLRLRGAKRIVLYVTHGIFSRGLEVFEGLIDEIISTDSFTNPAMDGVRVIKYAADLARKNQPELKQPELKESAA